MGLLVATSGGPKVMIHSDPTAAANAAAAAVELGPGTSAGLSEPMYVLMTPPNALGAIIRQHTSAARRACLVIDIFVLTPSFMSLPGNSHFGSRYPIMIHPVVNF